MRRPSSRTAIICLVIALSVGAVTTVFVVGQFARPTTTSQHAGATTATAPSSGSTTTPTAESTTPSIDHPTTTTLPRTSEPTSDPRDKELDWLPYGPADPQSPPPVRWYETFKQLTCATPEEPTGVWVAVAAVCLAVTGRDTTQWAVAESVDLSGAGATQGTACLEEAARALVRRALEWHQRYPGRQPKVRLAASGGAAACQPRILDVRLSDGSETCGRLPTQTGLRGGLGGATTLVLRTKDVYNVVSIRFGEQPTSPQTCPDPDEIQVFSPGVDHPQVVSIQLVTSFAEVLAPATFEYVDDTTTPTSSR